VPGSRLLVSSGGADDRGAPPPSLLALLESGGVPLTRLEFVGRLPHGQYLRLYDTADVALDTFPHNGGVTTCDALWMGVPTVTLAGGADRPTASRFGASLLAAVGLAELVAHTPERYVHLAAALAGDRRRLAELRVGLRQRLARSPLGDGRGYTRGLERAYRGMWRQWCARAPDA